MSKEEKLIEVYIFKNAVVHVRFIPPRACDKCTELLTLLAKKGRPMLQKEIQFRAPARSAQFQ